MQYLVMIAQGLFKSFLNHAEKIRQKIKQLKNFMTTLKKKDDGIL